MLNQSLAHGEVHVWYANPEELASPDLAGRACSLLTFEERERMARLYFERDRRLLLATRVLVRTVLSRYEPVAPQRWYFVANRYGRPEIASPSCRLRFNLTNTRGLVACAVARELSVGIDAEHIRSGDSIEVADRVFAPSEVDALHALPPALQPLRFVEYWTLKESYIKARGLGLALPLDAFWFQLQPGEAPRLEIDPELGDDGASWHLEQLRPTAQHLVALCVRRPAAHPVTVSAGWHSLTSALDGSATSCLAR